MKLSTDPMGWLLIGQVARRTGLSAPTIRYYEEIGVLSKPKRSVSGYRRYRADVIIQLRFIQLAQELGLSLDEVKPLLRLIGSRTRASPALLRYGREQLATADKRIRELELFRAKLGAVLGPSG